MDLGEFMSNIIKSFFVASSLAFCIFIFGCGSSSSDKSESESVYSKLPTPSKSAGVGFSSTGLYSLSPTNLQSGNLGNSVVSDYALYSEQDTTQGWSFVADKELLSYMLDADKVTEYESNISKFVEGILGHKSVATKLDEVVSKFPHFNGINSNDLSAEIHKVELTSVVIEDDVSVQGGGTRSAITLNFILPFQYTAQIDGISACNEIINGLQATDPTFITPANSNKEYEISVSLVFFVENLGLFNSAELLTTDKDTISSAEEQAVADSLGLLIWFLDGLNTHDIPSYDALFTFQASNELAENTLGAIHGVAKGIEDIECLMAIDSYLPEASLVIPTITSDTYLDTDYEYYIQTYSTELDLLTSGSEFGASCLYDKNGNIVTIDGESTCSTASGTYDLLKGGIIFGEASSMSSVSADYSQKIVISPYQKIVQQNLTDHAGVSSTSNICNSEPWKSLSTPRFGRGIKLSLSEWAVHGQVADYWNIRWYQRAGSASAQTAISAGAFVVKLVVINAMGGIDWSDYAMSSASMIVKVVSKLDVSIAGYKLGGETNSKMGEFFVAALRFGALDAKNYLKRLGVTQTVEALAQMAQTQATGWQDYYSGSHKVCGFQFK